MKQILGFGALIAGLSAGCGHFDYTVEPVKEVKQETPVNRESNENAGKGNLAAKLYEPCPQIELKNGTYLGQKDLLPIEYEVQGDGKRCTLRLPYGKSELYDMNCDNAIDALYVSEIGNFSRETLQKQGYAEKLDELLKWGQSFACLGNKESNIQLKLRFDEIFGPYAMEK